MMKETPSPASQRRTAAALAVLAASLFALPGCDRRPTQPPNPSTDPAGIAVETHLALSAQSDK